MRLTRAQLGYCGWSHQREPQARFIPRGGSQPSSIDCGELRTPTEEALWWLYRIQEHVRRSWQWGVDTSIAGLCIINDAYLAIGTEFLENGGTAEAFARMTLEVKRELEEKEDND